MTDIPPEKKPSREQDERDRRAANIFLLLAAAAFIAVGIWIGDELLKAKRADEALYDAKRKGRNRVVAMKKSILGRVLSW